MSPSAADRLGTYRSSWNRAVLGLALLGILVVAHLYIQQGRGFDRGCFGFGAPASVQATFDCSAVVSSGAGTLFGVSNVFWGLGFYSIAVLLSLGFLFAGRTGRVRLNAARQAVLTGGLLYSIYLSYVQFVQLGDLCALCLTSAGVATTLFLVQTASLFVPFGTTDTSMSTRFLKREIIRSTYLIALAAVLVGADFAYFNSLEDAAPPEEATTQAAAADRAETAARTASDPACQLDPTKNPVSDWQSLVNMQDPMQGSAGADVTVIEYFDPNCPHCKDFHEAMKPIVDEYEDEVHFVYKPFPLRSTSLPEVEALYAAAQQGKFFEMLTAQFARQSRGGIVEQDLREIAPEIGMKADVLMTKINQNKHRSYIVQQRQRAIQMGVNSTPTVLVNGHFVRSRSPECMRQFIERAKSGDLGAS
jgi:protein-disulfide isomerase/uncharacterized membrane protein